MRTNMINGLNREALLLSVSALKNDDTHLINELGLQHLSEGVRLKIAKLSLHQVLVAADFRGALAEVKIVPRQMEYFINMATSKSEEDAMIDEAIASGMRQPVLQELKGTTRREYTARRTKLKLPENPRGRIENLSEDDELIVLRSWRKHADISDPLARYLAVHHETGIGLDRAYLAINQTN